MGSLVQVMAAMKIAGQLSLSMLPCRDRGGYQETTPLSGIQPRDCAAAALFHQFEQFPSSMHFYYREIYGDRRRAWNDWRQRSKS